MLQQNGFNSDRESKIPRPLTGFSSPTYDLSNFYHTLHMLELAKSPSNIIVMTYRPKTPKMSFKKLTLISVRWQQKFIIKPHDLGDGVLNYVLLDKTRVKHVSDKTLLLYEFFFRICCVSLWCVRLYLFGLVQSYPCNIGSKFQLKAVEFNIELPNRSGQK